jgi:hypothetical protein
MSQNEDAKMVEVGSNFDRDFETRDLELDAALRGNRSGCAPADMMMSKPLLNPMSRLLNL